MYSQIKNIQNKKKNIYIKTIILPLWYSLFFSSILIFADRFFKTNTIESFFIQDALYYPQISFLENIFFIFTLSNLTINSFMFFIEQKNKNVDSIKRNNIQSNKNVLILSSILNLIEMIYKFSLNTYKVNYNAKIGELCLELFIILFIKIGITSILLFGHLFCLLPPVELLGIYKIILTIFLFAKSIILNTNFEIYYPKIFLSIILILISFFIKLNFFYKIPIRIMSYENILRNQNLNTSIKLKYHSSNFLFATFINNIISYEMMFIFRILILFLIYGLFVLDYSLKIDLNSLMFNRNNIFHHKYLKKIKYLKHILFCSFLSICLTYLDIISLNCLKIKVNFNEFQDRFSYSNIFQWKAEDNFTELSKNINISTFSFSSALDNMVKFYYTIKRIFFFSDIFIQNIYYSKNKKYV